jgi:hypothetical protein
MKNRSGRIKQADQATINTLLEARTPPVPKLRNRRPRASQQQEVELPTFYAGAIEAAW